MWRMYCAEYCFSWINCWRRSFTNRDNVMDNSFLTFPRFFKLLRGNYFESRLGNSVQGSVAVYTLHSDLSYALLVPYATYQQEPAKEWIKRNHNIDMCQSRVILWLREQVPWHHRKWRTDHKVLSYYSISTKECVLFARICYPVTLRCFSQCRLWKTFLALTDPLLFLLIPFLQSKLRKTWFYLICCFKNCYY
jgi:hypothetical protein